MEIVSHCLLYESSRSMLQHAPCLRGPVTNRIMKPWLRVSVERVSLLTRDRHGLERGPQSAGFPLAAIATAMSVRVIFGGHPETQHSRCCACPAMAIVDLAVLSPPRQCHADIRAMLIVPRGFYQQPSDQRVPGPRDPAPPMLSPLVSARPAPARIAVEAAPKRRSASSCTE